MADEIVQDRYEPNGWTLDGEKITTGPNLARIREAADRGGIIVRYWFYRGARCPDIGGFTDFDQALAKGKLPDRDGAVPLHGAY